MSKQKKKSSKLKMQHERNRLASFVGLPEHIPIIALLLATAGFYRSNNPKRRDEVICFSCGCRLSDWSSEDDHHERHSKVSPRCPMVTDHSAGRRLAGNVPFGTEPPGDLGVPPGDLESWNTSSTATQNTGVTSDQNSPDSYHQHHNTASYPHAGFNTSSEKTSPPTSTSATTNTTAYYSRPTSQLRSTSDTAYHKTPSSFNNTLSSILDQQRTPETSSQRDHRLKLLKRESVRLQTFTTWAECAPVDKHLVARAGFYYIGPGDRVRCAFCYNMLRMWEKGDIPEREHKRYFPRCPLVASPLFCGNVLVEDDHAPLPRPSVVQPRVMTSPSGPRTDNLQEQGPTTNGAQSIASATRQPSEHTRLLEENRRLKDAEVCKICMGADINVLFLPCGHLVCCYNCSSAVDACPICRKIIAGTVKIYKS